MGSILRSPYFGKLPDEPWILGIIITLWGYIGNNGKVNGNYNIMWGNYYDVESELLGGGWGSCIGVYVGVVKGRSSDYSSYELESKLLQGDI